MMENINDFDKENKRIEKKEIKIKEIGEELAERANFTDPQTPEATLIEKEKKELQKKSFHILPPIYRQVWEMKLSGLSEEEIAESLKIPVGTVKNRLNEGIKELAKRNKDKTVRKFNINLK